MTRPTLPSLPENETVYRSRFASRRARVEIIVLWVVTLLGTTGAVWWIVRGGW